MFKLNPQNGEVQEISILDIMGGAIQERADLELQGILKNIADLNTDLKKVRTLTIKFFLTACEERSSISVDVQVDSKKAPLKKVSTQLTLGELEGRLVAVEQSKAIPGQLDLTGREQGKEKVINLGSAKRA